LITSLQCDVRVGLGYSSATQIARVVTEHWCSLNLYCAFCSAESLTRTAPNTKAVDFRCSSCKEAYQLKSQKHLNVARVVDGAYATMLAAVQQNSAPNLLILNYSEQWVVRQLILIPSVFFTESVIQRRTPLSEKARRAGWVGCNLLLSNVPGPARIPLVSGAGVVPPALVREKFGRHRRLRSVEWHLRGWTLDVLKIASGIGRSFTLEQVYGHESELLRLHPANRNVKPKIRQQLQVLRDLGYLDFLGKGKYRLVQR
jgi:type II restriction enzyme